MTRVQFEELLPHEIVEARTKKPVAFLPVGTLEWHGEHDCMGLDAVKAHALSVHFAEQGGGIAFPAQFWGDNREYIMESRGDPDGKIAARFGLPKSTFAPGYMDKTCTEQELFYIQLLLHMMRTVESYGFKVIVVIAGHYGLRPHADSAVHLFAAGHQQVRSAVAWVCTGFELVGDVLPDAGDHAGKWETSLMLALRPDCVDMSRLPADPDQELLGVGGNRPPQEASAEYGRRAVDLITERVFAKVDELLATFP